MLPHLVLVSSPAPHVAEHGDHAPQAAQLQGRGASAAHSTATPPRHAPCQGSALSRPLRCQWLPLVR